MYTDKTFNLNFFPVWEKVHRVSKSLNNSWIILLCFFCFCVCFFSILLSFFSNWKTCSFTTPPLPSSFPFPSPSPVEQRRTKVAKNSAFFLFGRVIAVRSSAKDFKCFVHLCIVSCLSTQHTYIYIYVGCQVRIFHFCWLRTKLQRHTIHMDKCARKKGNLIKIIRLCYCWFQWIGAL